MLCKVVLKIVSSKITLTFNSCTAPLWRNVVVQGLEAGEGRDSVIDPAGRGTPGLHGTHG